jgi:hypothetical protein
MYVEVFVKKHQLDARFILGIFRQPVHVSGLSLAHHQEVQPYVYNDLYSFYMTVCCPGWFGTSLELVPTQPGQQTVIQKE